MPGYFHRGGIPWNTGPPLLCPSSFIFLYTSHAFSPRVLFFSSNQPAADWLHLCSASEYSLIFSSLSLSLSLCRECTSSRGRKKERTKEKINLPARKGWKEAWNLSRPPSFLSIIFRLSLPSEIVVTKFSTRSSRWYRTGMNARFILDTCTLSSFSFFSVFFFLLFFFRILSLHLSFKSVPFLEKGKSSYEDIHSSHSDDRASNRICILSPLVTLASDFRGKGVNWLSEMRFFVSGNIAFGFSFFDNCVSNED